MGVRAPKRIPGALRSLQIYIPRPKSAPRGHPDGPRVPRIAESSLQGAQDGPKTAQEAPKTPQEASLESSGRQFSFDSRGNFFGLVAFPAFRRAKTSQEVSKTATIRPQRPPRAPQDGPIRSLNSKRGAQDRRKGPQDGPRRDPTGDHEPKIRKRPQEAPRGPQETPKTPKRLPRGPRRPPRDPKETPKRARGPSWTVRSNKNHTHQF